MSCPCGSKTTCCTFAGIDYCAVCGVKLGAEFPARKDGIGQKWTLSDEASVPSFLSPSTVVAGLISLGRRGFSLAGFMLGRAR